MQIYQVGGAVRDKLLNQSEHDKDYVVVGATEAEMLELGYKKVGKSFPVFLHPETGEEYALARKEIKTGQGHCDFQFVFTPDITLQEDSLRRDFTCNAIYQNPQTGEVIDYHNGIQDIKNRVLRHVSEHFAEDPLRVLRMCRFAAQLNFEVAPETMELCRAMVKNGVLKHLSRDRIWKELEKAMCFPAFYRFVETARCCGALAEILPEVEQLWHIPERTDYHPEGNSGAHTMLALKAACSCDSVVNFTVLLHDIGKTLTPPQKWPSHRGHDKLGEELVRKISRRLKSPTVYSDFAAFATANHMLYHRPLKSVVREMAKVAMILARPEHKEYFRRYTDVLKADMQGRKKDDFTQEMAEFSCFETYLKKLAETAAHNTAADLPQFADLIENIKTGKISPTVLKEAYVEFLINANPL